MIDGSKPAIPSRPKTPNQSDSRPKTPIDRPKTPTRTLIEDHGKPPLGNRHMEMFSTHNDLRRDHDEIRDLGSQGQDLNQLQSSSEFYDINTRPPPGPRHDQYRNEQRTFRPDTFSRSNSAAQFNSHDREREVTKPGMFRSRTPVPDMLHRGHGPDYRGDHQRPKTPTAQDMRSKTPLPGSSYNYSDRGGYQNNTFGMNGPSRQGFGQQRRWGFNNYPRSPPTVRRGGDDYQDPYQNNFITFSQKGAGHPSCQSTSFEDVNPAPSNLTPVPERLPLQSNSSFNSQYSSSPRLPPRMSNREEAVRMAEYSVTLSRQDSGFGFRIIGGIEEGSQVSVGYIVPQGAADLDTRIRTGDEITRVDGISVLNSTHQRVVLLMTNAGTTGRVTLGLRRRILVSGETSYNGMSEVYDVTVKRREMEGFGFVIVSETKSWSVIEEFIGRILENSPAERCGRLHVGDRILAVNGVDISYMHHEEIVNLIKEAGYYVTLTIGIPQDDASSTTSNSQKGSQGSMVNAMAYPTSNDTDMRRYPPQPLPGDRMKEINRQRSMSNHQHSDEEEYLVVELQRGSRGFGFSIRGGTEFNSMPLFVLRIAEDGPADMDGRLRVGDQILEMNGFRTDNMSHSDAIDVIQYGGTNVRLLILRTGKLPPNFENNIQLPWLVDDREFQHMLSNGEFLSYENCVSLCGPSKAGKSTLASLLIGEDIPLTWNSTDGLVIYFGRNGIDMKEKKMVPLKGGEKGHPVFSKILRGNPGIHKNYSVDLSSKKQRTSFALSTGGIMSTKESTTKESQRCFDSGEHRNGFGSRDLNSGIYSIKSSEGHPRTQSLSYGIEELLKDDNDTLKLQADILEEVKNGQYRIDVAPSDLVDFGGQKSYDMTHQLFIQHGGSFVLLFDARFGLHNNLQEYPQGDINAASILKHWVDSILTYTEDSGDIMPMIVFAATHRDMCNQNKITKLKEDFTLEIRQMFSGHEKKNHIFLDTVYFISSIDTQDSEIQSMTNQLVSFAMKQSSWGQRRPMAWVPLEIQIARLKTQGVTIITKTQLEQLNSLNEEHALTETGLKYFLLIQHSLGKLKYYNLPGLDQFIVIYPPALVSILASFITDEIFWPKKLDLRMVLQTLTETGKISKKDLFKIWEQDHFQHFFRDDETKEFVITLLIHLDILIIPKGFKQKSMSEIYLVPCTVKASPPPNFFDSRVQKEHTISLAYSLSLHSIPSALAYKAVSSVASVWPLQEISGKLCLYHKAAFFHADENDLRIYLDDNRIMVHLTNRSSNLLSISPDVAASIQECLTMNLNSSLLSYYNMCGRKHNKMEDLFKIEVGLPCKDTVCFQTMFEANKVSDWVCLNGKKHKTKYLRYWSFDRKQEECPTDCLGLDAVELQAVPSNKHLIRLSSQFRIQSFKAYILNLGLKEKDYENISQQYETNGPESVMFMALIKWRDTQLYHCTLQQLHDALVEVEIDCHRICQISRKDTALLDIAEGSLLCSPKDDVLLNLSHNVGNCTIQLGIELGLEIDAILETMYRYPRDMHQQNLDILKKWKETCTKPTVLSLMQALKCVQSGGLQFMMKKYHIAS